MINFDVTYNCQYRELKVEVPDASLSTGLLDEVEALTIAKQLISAAEDLLPSECGEQVELLGKIRERLQQS